MMLHIIGKLLTVLNFLEMAVFYILKIKKPTIFVKNANLEQYASIQVLNILFSNYDNLESFE